MSITETKQCQNCNNNFTIVPEDFEFYKKVQVPAPTFCPDCRLQRKLVFRNERTLYRRDCDLCKKRIVSIFNKDSLYFERSEKQGSEQSEGSYTVYCSPCWWSDNWDSMEYSKEYDFEKPFFEQLKELWKKVPQKSLNTVKAINSEYCESINECKNCYLVVGGYRAENCLYSLYPILTRDSIDSEIIFMSDHMYECINCNNSFSLSFSKYCDDCLNSSFLYDCRNCTNSFACINLRNKKYHIFNKAYSKEEYEKKIKEMDLGSYKSLLKAKKLFKEEYYKYPRRFAEIRKSVDVTGDNISNAKNCYNCFVIRDGAENCKYSFTIGLNTKDSYDVFSSGENIQLAYESNSLMITQKILFSNRVNNSINILYSSDIYNSHDIFGCIGLRNKKYCILNKQYTKEEYEELVPKIIKHMG